MDDTRIAELLAPFLDNPAKDNPFRGAAHNEAGRSAEAISAVQLRSISMYIDLMLRWNARINLTAVSAPEEIVTRHFGESFFAAQRLFPATAAQTVPAAPGSWPQASRPHVIDVGSGAGFPGLPIKIWAPQVRLTLIESNQKKATFLREVIRSLSLTDAEVFAGRAENFPKATGDAVTLRAVERFEAILPVAARLTGPGGRLAMLVGDRQLSGIPELATNLKWSEPTNMPMSSHRVLIIGSKES